MVLSDEGRKNLIVFFSCFQLIFTAATLFGWPALLVVLKDEGQYDEVCPESSLSSNSGSFSTGENSNRGVAKCAEQEVRLNLVFTIASVANAVSCSSGMIFDFLGPRISMMFGGTVCNHCAVSSILFS